MKPVSEALSIILSHATSLPGEPVPLAAALGRTLRENARADADLPAFDCSAMDGYAYASADLGSSLAIVAEIQAGSMQEITLQPGQCARIFTGARIPAGADRVAIQEEAVAENGVLTLPHTAATGPSHIRHQGENCRKGDVIVPAGRRLGAIDLAALASCGIVQPLVSRQPRVVHFATGNELVDPSSTPTGAQIRDCNSTLVAALLQSLGAALVHQSRLPDDLDASLEALRAMETEADDFDLLLISGGASVGDYDYTRPLLERSGFEFIFHGVNLRPGKPLLFAKRGRQLAFGLPGNPVSHAVIFPLFIAPLLSAMHGTKQPLALFEGRMEGNFSCKANPRETWWPCRATWREGAFRLCPLPFQSSGDITGSAGANALLRLAPGRGEIKEADTAEFLWLQSIN